jgi:hypothetical protein
VSSGRLLIVTVVVLGAGVLLTGCGSGAKSLSAADDAIRTQDDFARAADDFAPPWTPRVEAPPPAVAEARAVSPVVESAPGRLQSVIDELRESEARELIEKGACALLKYQLEYSETPSIEAIADYLGQVSDDRGLVWLTSEDRSILAAELDSAASDLASLGLSPDGFAALTEVVCEVVG